MQVSKLLASFVSVILAGTMLAGCGDDSSEAPVSNAEGQKVTKVRLAFTPGATTLNTHIALTRGIFKKHGLEVEPTEGLDLPTWAAGLDKQWDIIMTTPGIFASAVQKVDLVVLAAGQVTTKDSIVANPLITRDPKINKAIDLVGMRVGVATLTGSTPTSIQHLIKQEGGDPKKVQFVQLPFNAQGDQLKAGGVDAVVSSVPFGAVLLEDRANRALFDVQDAALRTIAPNQEVMASILYISTRSWATQNPEAAKAFLDASLEAKEWVDANEQEAKAEMSKWLGIPSDVISKVEWPLPVQPRIGQAELQPVIDLFVAAGVTPQGQAPDLSNRFPNK